MFPLPSPPDTLVVRQLECVSCKEKFAIAEDYPRTNGTPGQFWRLTPDAPAETQLRYEPDRSRRTVTPQSRSAPNSPAEVIMNHERSQRSHLNCPRCGTDNRNWLNILLLEINPTITNVDKGDSPRKSFMAFWKTQTRPVEKIFLTLIAVVLLLMSLALLATISTELAIWTLAGSVTIFSFWSVFKTDNYRLWRRRFPAAHAGNILAIVLAFVASMMAFSLDLSTGKILLMASFVILSPISILFSLTSPWIKLRENQHLRRVAPKTSNFEGELWLRGFLSLFIFTVILPILFFRLFPIGVSATAEYLRRSSEEEITTTVEEDGVSSELVIDGTNPAFLTKHQEAIDKALDEVGAETKLMALWVLNVGLASFTAVLLGMFALKEFVTDIDRQIPPPIFHSLASMTRVTVWEAKQALEVTGDMNHIQWTRVSRNEDGGINLVGVHVTETAVDQPAEKYRPAQEYTITADAWARIVKAKIKRTRVLVTATPESQIEKAFFKQVPQPVQISVRSSNKR